MTAEQKADQLLVMADRFSQTVEGYRLKIAINQDLIETADPSTTALMHVEIEACKRAIQVLEDQLPDLIYSPARSIHQALKAETMSAAA